MPNKHLRDICIRCQEGPKWIKARHLCDSCYMKVKALGTLEDWPRADEMKRRHHYDGWCHCMSPIPQRLYEWKAVQCLKCGKKLPDDH